jgi:hypothetical protein
MKQIAVIYRHSASTQEIVEALEAEGHAVWPIPLELYIPVQFDASAYDLAVIHLAPDIATAWGTFHDFREWFPGLPVVLYMCRNNIETLKSAIKDVFKKKKQGAPPPPARRPASPVPPGWRLHTPFPSGSLEPPRCMHAHAGSRGRQGRVPPRK